MIAQNVHVAVCDDFYQCCWTTADWVLDLSYFADKIITQTFQTSGCMGSVWEYVYTPCGNLFNCSNYFSNPYPCNDTTMVASIGPVGGQLCECMAPWNQNIFPIFSDGIFTFKYPSYPGQTNNRNITVQYICNASVKEYDADVFSCDNDDDHIATAYSWPIQTMYACDNYTKNDQIRKRCRAPTAPPSNEPTSHPSNQPSDLPTALPTSSPTTGPTVNYTELEDIVTTLNQWSVYVAAIICAICTLIIIASCMSKKHYCGCERLLSKNEHTVTSLRMVNTIKGKEIVGSEKNEQRESLVNINDHNYNYNHEMNHFVIVKIGVTMYGCFCDIGYSFYLILLTSETFNTSDDGLLLCKFTITACYLLSIIISWIMNGCIVRKTFGHEFDNGKRMSQNHDQSDNDYNYTDEKDEFELLEANEPEKIDVEKQNNWNSFAKWFYEYGCNHFGLPIIYIHCFVHHLNLKQFDILILLLFTRC